MWRTQALRIQKLHFGRLKNQGDWLPLTCKEPMDKTHHELVTEKHCIMMFGQEWAAWMIVIPKDYNGAETIPVTE